MAKSHEAGYLDDTRTWSKKKDDYFSFTLGTSYALTDNLYGLIGAGIRYQIFERNIEPAGISCSNSSTKPEPEPNTNLASCVSDSKLGVAGQVGLIPKLPGNTDSELRQDARTRRSEQGMAFPFQALQRSADFLAELPSGKTRSTLFGVIKP